MRCIAFARLWRQLATAQRRRQIATKSRGRRMQKELVRWRQPHIDQAVRFFSDTMHALLAFVCLRIVVTAACGAAQ